MSVLSQSTIDWVTKTLEQYKIPGFAVAVVKDGQSQMETFGRRNDTDPWLPESLCPIASISKSFTGLTMALLIHKAPKLKNGQTLAWTSKLKDILPNWTLQDKYVEQHVDISDFLCMRSGLPMDAFARFEESPAESMLRLPHLGFSRELREEFQYCTLGFNVIAEVVAHVSGMSYADFIQQELFDPLGLKDTLLGYDGDRQYVDGFVRPGDGATPYCAGRYYEKEGPWNPVSGGIIMSIKETIPFLQELITPSKLPESVMNVGQTPVVAGNSVAIFPQGRTTLKTYSHGFATSHYRDHIVHGGAGGLWGLCTIFTYVPSIKAGVFVMCNDQSMISLPFATNAVDRILDDLMGLDPLPDRIDLSALTSPPSALEIGGHADGPNISGCYHHDAYGELNIRPYDLCAPTALSKAIVFAARRSPLRTIFAESSNWHMTTMPDRFLVTHLLFRHAKAESTPDLLAFDVFPFQLYPTLQTGEMGGIMMAKAKALVRPGSGLGMFENWWSGTRGSPLLGRPIQEVDAVNVKERCEAWFEKI